MLDGDPFMPIDLKKQINLGNVILLTKG